MSTPDLVLRIEGRAPWALVAVVLLCATSARANVDYEDQAVGPLAPGAVLSFDGPLFVISSFAPTEIADGVACAPNCPDNGTKYQKTDTSGVGGGISVQGSLDIPDCAPDCNRFDLLSIDVAEPTQSSGPVWVIITPLSTGTPVPPAVGFTTDGVADGPGGAPDFETVTLPGDWRDLEQVVVISGTPGVGFAIDNLITEPATVPALGSWGLLALAGAIAGAAWRFSRVGAARPG